MISTVIVPLLGGVLIGLAAILLLLFNGKIAGISGIVGGSLANRKDDRMWRLAFVGGLLFGGLIVWQVSPSAFPVPTSMSHAPMAVLVIAGFLVGFGTRLGSGCTSGHGVCGMSRLSPRSIVATLTFIATGAVAVLVARLLGVAS